MVEHVKLRAGKYMKPATLKFEGNNIYVQTGFNRALIDEIKNMAGAHWCGYDEPPRKVWRITNCDRNIFALTYLRGTNVYVPYTCPLKSIEPTRPLYEHQREALNHIYTRRHCIYGGEMGVGKTLVAIELMEYLERTEHLSDWVWVGPRSAINAVKAEFRKWDCGITPTYSTYASLHKLFATRVNIPHGIIFDECSKVKNPMAVRSKSAVHFANSIRDKWGKNSIIVGLSGTPAPKNPCDWWNLAELTCPGFLKEGNILKLRNRLAIIESRESISGGQYPHLIGWRDSDDKCNICGELKDHANHDMVNFGQTAYHPFEQSCNEVEKLGRRLKGLVLVHFKKDCLDLPDKIYRVIDCEVTKPAKRALEMIKSFAPRAITALTLARELSDGFQYKEKETDKKVACPICSGKGIFEDVDFDKCEEEQIDWTNPTQDIPMKSVACETCDGSGIVNRVDRVAEYVGTPKEKVLKDVLEEHEDVGRLVVSAALRASIDRIVEIVEKEGWDWIRIDGRGWHSNLPLKEDEMIESFQNGDGKLCIIMHPESGGMGLTLTASPSILIYSNDFKAENRIQLEDRIHRPGMDNQRGATIIDINYLPTDAIIRDNLMKKKALQKMSMEELSKYL